MKARIFVAGMLVAMATTSVSAETYQVSVTNNLDYDFLAPVLMTSTANDQDIFSGEYVTAEAEDQILTGDPINLASRIAKAGGQSFIAHSREHESGILLAPGETITFEINTDVKELRVLAMIKSNNTPDNYVTGVVSLSSADTAAKNLVRYDIGHDEGRRTREEVTGKYSAGGSDCRMMFAATCARRTGEAGDARDAMVMDKGSAAAAIVTVVKK